MRFSNVYVVGFAAGVCLICSIFVSAASVLLKDRQEMNARLFKQQNILRVSGVVDAEAVRSVEQVEAAFTKSINTRLIDLASGDYVENEEALLDNYRPEDAEMKPAEENPARVRAVPANAVVYEVVDDGTIVAIILPVEGKGLWSTLYGYLALNYPTLDIRGITFYQHAETPGLGGEIDNPKWKARWEGVQAFDETGAPIVEVVKGQADQPHEVDGLSGATLTSRGVTNLVQFWIGDNGYGPYLAKIRGARD